MMRKDTSSLLVCLMIAVILAGALVQSGCKKSQSGATSVPPTVEVATVIQKDVPIYSEWIASTDGSVNATIRAQVQGYLIKQNYKEGDFVRKGQVLFEIDSRTLQAALDHAKAQLTEQQARWEIARANLERVRPLADEKAISLKDLDDAVGTEQATRASVGAAKAAVERAQVDIGFTRIASPIDGVAGIAKAQMGNLVGPGSIEELTTVSTVDPIKVYIPMSEQEYIKTMQSKGGRTNPVPLQLILADGSVHKHTGRFAYADRQVDVKTGTIKVAALFPNPGNMLRPGQFARVRAETTVKKGGLLVPQRAVMELQGRYQVALVNANSKVEIRPVRVAERVDNLWLIDEGLKPGERVIAEGLQKVKPDMVVTVKSFEPGGSVRPESLPAAVSSDKAAKK